MTVSVLGRPTRLLDVGSGPVLLCSSGVASVVWDWLPVAALLRDRFRVVVVERPGYAPGDPVPAHLPDLAEEAARLVAVLEAREIAGPVTAVGHSFGAAVAEAAARLHPERVCSLVLLDGSVPEAEGVAAGDDAARAAHRFRSLTRPAALSRPVGWVWRVVAAAVFTALVPARRTVVGSADDSARGRTRQRHPEAPASSTLAASLRELAGYRSCMRELVALRSAVPLAPELPVLVVAANGRLPRRRPSAWVRHVLRQARALDREARVTTRVVSGSGHFVMLDRPVRTAELVTEAAGR
ncbi:alpha/beta fold hydrolase [Kocuria sp.]|uniref:alpha/beta fold hydrolase n=1 Tax=Kocuria sp. TaxID=1871328 RepID=UPI0026DA89B1|nr:alpha/beta hydrolase [Kocuria sp.]MDO4919600.1 alpha/beta hydrolase [Kocuria sp.]